MNQIATQQSQVATQLEQMEQTHDELHKAILELDDRLSSVTRDAPKEKDSGEVATPELVPLASILWNKNDFLQLVTKKLIDLRQRIEL